MDTSNKPVIVKQTFNSSIERVWDAITKVDQMTQWFFDNIPEFEPRIGFQTRFNVNTGERDFLHLWKIIEVEPFKKIKYHWSYEGYVGEGFVTFELSEKDQGTLLKLTMEGLATFTDDVPEFTRESCEGGWNYFIRENLKGFID